MADIVLKRCPFCGGNNAKVSNDGTCYFVYCDDCICQTTYYNTLEHAIKAWNKRVDTEYKKGYKDGWNSCVRSRADGWTVDYMKTEQEGKQ